MKLSKRSALFLILAVFFAAVACGTCAAPSLAGGRAPARVLRVIDGDTLVCFSSGQELRVRLIGIDTPESAENKRAELQCRQMQASMEEVLAMGQEAKAHLKTLLPVGAKITLVFDVVPLDKYGRTLAYAFRGNTHINERMLSDGYAMLLTIPPNVSHERKFHRAFHKAVESGRGLWKKTNH